MSRHGRILVVDNDKKWCGELVGTLQRDGFSADAIENVSQALERLSTAIYHIVILDIRFEDSDQSNTEGIDLLQELARRGLKEATKVIMLSAYGTLEYMRRAFKDYEVADFLSKTDSPQVLLDSVRQVFVQKVKINLALDIQWPLKSIPERIVSNLQVNGKRVGRNWKQMVDELEDMFCRLFHEAETVRVWPLTPGRSGAGVVWVQRLFKGRGKGQDVIVKFGDLNRIRKEYYNF